MTGRTEMLLPLCPIAVVPWQVNPWALVSRLKDNGITTFLDTPKKHIDWWNISHLNYKYIMWSVPDCNLWDRKGIFINSSMLSSHIPNLSYKGTIGIAELRLCSSRDLIDSFHLFPLPSTSSHLFPANYYIHLGAYAPGPCQYHVIMPCQPI